VATAEPLKRARLYDRELLRGDAAWINSEEKVSPAPVKVLTKRIHLIQRRSYGLRYQEYRPLKILTYILPASIKLTFPTIFTYRQTAWIVQ